MHSDLVLAKRFVYDKLDFSFSNFKEESESEEYAACTFLLDNHLIKFRTSKITPTKVGQFVTLWKRNEAGITCPHEDSDPFDLYVISVRKENKFGQFVFPKSALIKQGILSTSEKEGKRGFRVYPPWDITDNKQSEKTQKRQSEFFLEINDGNDLHLDRAKTLYSK